jgi:hypothetical protein
MERVRTVVEVVEDYIYPERLGLGLGRWGREGDIRD